MPTFDPYDTFGGQEEKPLVDRVELVCGDRRLVCERSLLAGVLQLGGGDRLSVTEQMFGVARGIVLGNLPGGVR